MDDQVSKEVVHERFDRLVALQQAISLERMRQQVGTIVEVLVEGTGRKGRAQGRTRMNRVVHLDGDHAPGDFVEVRIAGAHPHHLDGEPVREPAAVA